MIALAILFALFLWWFSTGLILFAVSRAGREDGGAPRYIRLAIMSLPMLVAGLAAFVWAQDQRDPLHAYVGFTAAIAIWGWIELAFLTGVVTGPDRRTCPAGADSLVRFGYALRAILHHEVALLLSVFALVLIGWGAPNTVGLWTFLILFFARISAKLNVFLGVPNINSEFLPEPVRHLQSYFGPARTNRLFPVTVTMLTFALACWVERAYTQAGDPFALTGFTLLATLTGLAIAEHWLMVVRLPDAALWRWLIRDETTRLGSSAGRMRLDGQRR